MSLIDGIFVVLFLVVFIMLLALAYERQNGHIDGSEPEPTLRRQLQTCHYHLATARQSVEVYRSLTERQKAIIAELSEVLKSRE